MMRRSFLLTMTIFSFAFGQPGLSPGPAAAAPVSEKKLIDSSQFFADRIVQAKVPVLVDFWAAWCGPCRYLSPTIEELKKEYAGKIIVMKVNVDIHRGLANYFRISSIPAVFLIANKAVVEYLPGLQPKESYKQAIEKVLKDPGKPPAGETKQSGPKPQTSEKASSAGKSTPVADDE
jgi:thioredoxin 1